MLLTMLGAARVCTAADGAEALRAGAELRPDVVLLDLGMPDMDGYAVARRIREQPWGRDITLVALTGWGQERDNARTTEAGFDHHIVKPADIAALEAVFEHHSRRAGACHI